MTLIYWKSFDETFISGYIWESGARLSKSLVYSDCPKHDYYWDMVKLVSVVPYI